MSTQTERLITANELTKKIKNEKIRAETREFLVKTLAELDMIDGMGDNYSSQAEDGIPLRRIEEIESKQQEKISKLEKCQFFEPEEEEANPLNVKRQFGYTALMKAVVDHDIESVKQCLLQGADKTITDNGGNTPLEKARKLGYLDIVAILV